jgi:hypothetical protein
MQAKKNLAGEGDNSSLLWMWWTKKYQQSPKSAEFNAYTFWELLVEFFEDYYNERPEEAREGDTPFVTGDALIDKWEYEISQGLEPDLSEGMSSDEHSSFMGWSREVHRKKKTAMNFQEDVYETY